MITPADLNYIEQACELARRGLGYVEPNPMVGCIIVRDGQIWPAATINALEDPMRNAKRWRN